MAETLSIAALFDRVSGGDTGIEFTAYDGSRAGPRDAAYRAEIRSPRAVSYLIQSRADLGLARAYIAGDLELHGDLFEVLRTLWREHDGTFSWRDRWQILRSIELRHLRPVSPPANEHRTPRARRHSQRRDAAAISHHYDVSNRFYRWVLGPSMAYTCAVYPEADSTLEEAQFEKFDLVCRKLGLEPGMRLLDVGCGWGGMVVHAAEHYGVQAIGVTLSREQAEWGREAVEAAGLEDRAEVRFGDYRDVTESGFDAVSSIGLTEHVGKDQLPGYFSFLHSKLRPQGRLLNHCITRPNDQHPQLLRGGFIDRYVFPDGELLGPGYLASRLHDAGFELRHEENVREHYARTLKAWGENLEDHWDEAVREVGEAKARTWRLYMAGSRVSFSEDYLELHQMLGVRTEQGESGMPLRPDWMDRRSALGGAAHVS
jgi:cyclopropane-fatty-acyl-phospholipid synthase